MLVGALLLWGAPVQGAQGDQTSSAASTTPELKQSESARPFAAPGKHEDGKAQRAPSDAEKHAAGVDEVVQMVQAGVSTEVIKTYIENSPIAYSLSATDIIALKNHAVPDDLTMAMVKRGATLKRLVSQLNSLNAMPARYSASNRRYGSLDPESYDYFQYYYLYPRTLAMANQRLFTPYPSFPRFAPYPYGYYGPMPFNPLPPSALMRP
jgi:hypothetical protein